MAKSRLCFICGNLSTNKQLASGWLKFAAVLVVGNLLYELLRAVL